MVWQKKKKGSVFIDSDSVEFWEERKKKKKGRVVSVHSMKAYREVEVELHLFFTSPLDGNV